MATYSWPAAAPLPAMVALRQFHNNQEFVSPLSGFTQTASLPGARWGWSFEWTPELSRRRNVLEGLFTRLSGREHRLTLWDFKRPRPRGTINTSGVTASAASQFANTITLNGCGASTTLLAGDWFSVGGQLLMCVLDATATGGGVMTVEFRHLLRAAVSGGAAVTLVQPTALYLLSAPPDLPRMAGESEPRMAADFVEVFA